MVTDTPLLSRLSILAIGLFAPFLASCSTDISEGSQRAGQSCYRNAHCRKGLVCDSRRCVPASYSYTDAGARDTTEPDSSSPEPDSEPDTPIEPDIVRPPECQDGESFCISEEIVQICVDGSFTNEQCPDGQECQNGGCSSSCEDADGDGYGENCQAGSDCNDEDARVNPGQMERCDTPIDDNCNGSVNEGCTQCCPGGCGSGSYCKSCQCSSYDPSVCNGQYQPCNSAGQSNGYFCAELGSRRRCVDICDKMAADPASTCRTPNSACVFGDQNQGICLSGCTFSQGCGTQGVGCMAYDGKREGLCVPTNSSNKVGDSCDPETFFDCEQGAVCYDNLGMGDQGRCTEACRPFHDPQGTDCPMGKFCQPISSELGLCLPDNGKSEGDRCSSENQMCGSDNVGCFDARMGRRCLRLCRRSEGDADCRGGTSCNRVPQNDELGVCY